MFRDGREKIFFVLVLQSKEGGFLGILQAILLPSSRKEVWGKKGQSLDDRTQSPPPPSLANLKPHLRQTSRSHELVTFLLRFYRDRETVTLPKDV